VNGIRTSCANIFCWNKLQTFVRDPKKIDPKTPLSQDKPSIFLVFDIFNYFDR
jgi:hypothetical protein